MNHFSKVIQTLCIPSVALARAQAPQYGDGRFSVCASATFPGALARFSARKLHLPGPLARSTFETLRCLTL
jgi:hypothetical protein